MNGFDDDEDQEGLEYTGSFEHVDIVRYFVKAMQVAEQQDGALMSRLRSELTPDDQTHLQAYITEASSNA